MKMLRSQTSCEKTAEGFLLSVRLLDPEDEAIYHLRYLCQQEPSEEMVKVLGVMAETLAHVFTMGALMALRDLEAEHSAGKGREIH
jgi:hypothetical protein